MDQSSRYIRSLALTLGLYLFNHANAHAKCSRVIQVPVSPIGQSVLIDGDNVNGIYPELLRSLTDKEGCSFAFSEVPRARLEILFESGRADLLIPATKTQKRDMSGTFVALIQNRAALISLSSNRPTISSLRELQDLTSVKVALVRGFDYGPAYQELIEQLNKQGRLILDVDAVSVARLLKSGAVHMTIMAPTILAGAVQDDMRLRDLSERLRIEPVDELPWGYSGIYISNTALSPGDRSALQEALERAARSGEVWKAFQRYYSPTVLKSSIRPL